MEYSAAALKAFRSQRNGAKQRGIPFDFTIEEWWDWWQVDDRWSRRGRNESDLVMARTGDKGPYSLANVYCSTHAENRRVGRKPIGERPMTAAERQARRKARQHAELAMMLGALESVLEASSIDEARRIAVDALRACVSNASHP
jgi:hypothetical protein